jgi:ComF family protein
MFNFLKKVLLDAIFPIKCIGCQEFDQWLCLKCRQKIAINNSNQTFGHERIKYTDNLLIATLPNQELVDNIIHRCKYNFVPDLAEELGLLTVEFLKQIKGSNFYFDLVCAVPLSRRRLAWRGFNQSAIVARSIAEAFNWEYSDKALRKIYHTRPQVGLDSKSRKNNVSQVFLANEIVKGKRVLLVDDVVTTGSTLMSCSKELRRKGAKNVDCLVINLG